MDEKFFPHISSFYSEHALRTYEQIRILHVVRADLPTETYLRRAKWKSPKESYPIEDLVSIQFGVHVVYDDARV